MQTTTDQISLRDITNFISRYRSGILMAGILGLLLAAFFVAVTPKSYEARWQMSMAQMVAGNTNSNSEDPAALIQRLRTTLAYPEKVLNICGKSLDEEMDEYLDKTLQVQTVKNVTNIAEFKLRAPSVDQARSCANAIITMVIEQQRLIINERQAGRQEQLAQYQKTLRDENRQMERINRTELGNFGYLAMLDKLTWLRARIDGLQEEIFLSQKYPAKLTAPIEVFKKPVSPNGFLILTFGTLLGLMMGLLYAIVREGWKKSMSEA